MDHIYCGEYIELSWIRDSQQDADFMSEFQSLYDRAKKLLPECTLSKYLEDTDAVVCLETVNADVICRVIRAKLRDSDEQSIVNEVENHAIIRLVYMWGYGDLIFPRTISEKCSARKIPRIKMR